MSAVIGIFVGIAPAAFAWGSTGNVIASCWRAWLSDDVTFGADANNYTQVNATTRNNFSVWAIAYLKHNGANKSIVGWTKGTGTVRIRKDYSSESVLGDRTWTVDAYAYQYAPPNSSGQKHNACTIT